MDDRNTGADQGSGAGVPATLAHKSHKSPPGNQTPPAKLSPRRRAGGESPDHKKQQHDAQQNDTASHDHQPTTRKTVDASVAGVCSFLQERFRSFDLERAAWVRERKALRVAASRLKRELKAACADNAHLTRRIAMLEEVIVRERKAHGEPLEQVWKDEADATAPVLKALRDTPARQRMPPSEPAELETSAPAPTPGWDVDEDVHPHRLVAGNPSAAVAAHRQRSSVSSSRRRQRSASAGAANTGGASTRGDGGSPAKEATMPRDAEDSGDSDVFSEEEMEAAMAEAFSVVLGVYDTREEDANGAADVEDDDDDDDDDFVDAEDDSASTFVRDAPGLSMLEH